MTQPDSPDRSVTSTDSSVNSEPREPIIILGRNDYYLHGLGSVAKLGAATGMLNVFVADVDAHYTRVKAAGARIDFPPTDMPYGQREYAAFDCEGRIRSFATRT